MKTIYILFFTLLQITFSFAGNDQESKYRVVAHKNGSTQVVSESNEVTVTKTPAIFIPNAFTPDGDGINDAFGAVGQGITDFRMQVFNRWGELVFESNNMMMFWDGNHDQQKAEQGVYVYKVLARASDASQYFEMSGSVVLLR